MPKLITKLLILSSLLLLTACFSAPDNMAPVDSAWFLPKQSHDIYTVRKGDSLYSIAWRFDMDYRQLAGINRLSSPYSLTVGQKLRLRGHSYQTRQRNKSTLVNSKAIKTKPKTQRKLAKRSSNRQKLVHGRVAHWQWPAKGKLVRNYNLARRSKGIDIAGRRGSPIRATAAGRVAYSGDGLPGYGNLIIIKHNDEFLSAYAHTQHVKVKEGSLVKAGQRIASMGSSGSKSVRLHFEIRKAGKPVNPMRYLPKHG